MFQEENRSTTEISPVINTKNNTQWKKRVNLFRLVYAFLETGNEPEEIILNLDKEELNNKDFAIQREIFKNIVTNYDQYKALISANLKNWTYERISDVDKALFLCAIGEHNVLHTDAKIIIDQTLITAKKYSNPKSYKYINAILDKILN